MKSIYSQSLSLIDGINYGGPLPTKTNDSSFGHPIPGIHSGIAFEYVINERWTIIPELFYSFRGVDYSESFTKDTSVTIVINGISGTVPSFYTAYAEGSMRLHYLDLPLMISYKIKKISLLGGIYLSSLLKGRDQGNVRVVIGDGGFYDDYTEMFDNKKIIRTWDFGSTVGFKSTLYKKLSAELKITRSFCQLYKPGSMDGKSNMDRKLFHTFLHISLLYQILHKS